MIEIPVHNLEGKQVDSLQIDEAALGSEVRHQLLKQAYVYFHANRRQGSAATRSRGHVSGSTRKIFKQKGTGNARRGPIRSNIMRGGGVAHAKTPKSWRQSMPQKMRRLANRNALLAKAVDGEIKLIDSLSFDKPSTKQFASLLNNLKIDRSCLVALASTQNHEAKSAGNIDSVRVTGADRLNAFDLLNHRYLLMEKSVLAGWVEAAGRAKGANGKEAR